MAKPQWFTFSLFKWGNKFFKFIFISLKDHDKIKKEDLTLSFLRSVAEVQGHLAHVHALALRVKRVYFIGSFISMELMRRYLSEEINGRNLLRPQVGLRVMAPISALQEEHSLLTGPQIIFVYEEKLQLIQ